MPAVLITGMSGTGKSSVLRALVERGFRGIDTDDDGWCVDVDGEPMWDETRMRAWLVGSAAEVVFVAGCVVNQGEFDFTSTVLLSAPEQVLLGRVAERPDNPYGRTAEDRAEISRNLSDIEPLLRRVCDVELDATRPLPELVDEIERLGEAARC